MKLLIFDLDGTLLNTLTDLTNSINYMCECFNYEKKSEEQVRNAIGNGVPTLVKRLIPDGLSNPNYKNCLETFIKHYNIHYDDNTHPYEGVKQALENLKQNYVLGVVTNKLHEVACKIIDKYFPNTFTYVQGECLSLRKKPEADMVNKVINDSNIDKKDVIYIGDTEIDLLTAKNADIPCILVSYGYRNRLFLENLNSDCPIIDNFKDLQLYCN